MFSARMTLPAVATILASGLAATASADVTVTLTHQTFAGFNFSLAAAAGSLTGTFTGAAIDVVLENSVAYTYADDLCVYLDAGTLSTGGAVQIGGFSNLQAGQRYFWPNGGSDAVGTTSVGSVLVTGPIVMDGSDLNIWVGNGYGGAGTSGTWSGTITLLGVSNVPGPGAMALLGLAGVVARRRR